MNEVEHREYKGRIFGKFARMGKKALSGPKRLEILDLLAQAERTVAETARETATPVASVSQHLQVLKTTYYLPEGALVYYPHSTIGEDDKFDIGRYRLAAIFAPGHTPESTCYLLDGRALFTGDALFLSGVGCPDLEATPEQAREKARALHGSLLCLLDIPSGTIVLLGYTSEPVPFDGVPIAATLGEVLSDVALLHGGKVAFVEKVSGGVSPAPSNHERIVAFNRSGEMPQRDTAELEAGANRCAAG